MSRKGLVIAIMICVVSNISAQTTLRDSLATINRQLMMDPYNTDLLLKKGGAEVTLESWQSALDTYTLILKHDAKNPAALFYRAYAYEQLGRYAFARNDYEQYLKIVPFNYEGLLCLALMNHKDKHYTEAYDQINNLIEMYPDSIDSYIARANMEKDRRMIDTAIYDWGVVIEKQPENPQHYITRAELYIELEKKDEARRDLDMAVTLGIPKNSLNYLYNKVNGKK